MKKLFLFLFLLPSLACAHAGHSHSKDVPQKMKFYIGGMGAGQNVEVKEGLLYYTEYNRRAQKNVTEVVPVSDAQWEAFRKSLDASQVWGWSKEYMNNQVMDGTQWNFKIAYTDKSLETFGSNAYPLANGTSNNDPMPSETFIAFLAALNALTGKTIQ